MPLISHYLFGGANPFETLHTRWLKLVCMPDLKITLAQGYRALDFHTFESENKKAAQPTP